MIRNQQVKENSQSIGRGFAILSFASIAVKILSLIFVPVMRSLLGGDYGYGIFYASNEVYAFIYVLTTAGMPVAVSKIVSELTSNKNPREAERAFRLARFLLVVIGIIFSVLMVVLAKPIAGMMKFKESWAGILFLAPSVMICSVMAAYRGYFQGKRNMTPTALSQIIEQLVHVVFSIIAVVLLRKHGIVWAVAGASVGTVLGSLVSFIIIVGYRSARHELIRKESRKGRVIPTKKLIKTLVYYSVPITLSAGIQYGGNVIDASILKDRLLVAGFSKEISTSLYGALGATRQLINVPAALVSALCVSILPALTALYSKQDIKGTAEKAEYGFKLLYTVAMPIAFAMAVFSKEIYTILGFGDRYLLLSSMSFSVILLGTVHLQNSIMQSVNRLFQTTVYLGISVATKAILNFILVSVPVLNVYGAVISTYVSLAVPLLLNDYDLVRNTGLRINPARKAALPFFSSVAMIICAYIVHTLTSALSKMIFKSSGFLVRYIGVLVPFLITAVTGAIVYFWVLSYFGGLTEEDINSISPAIMKLLRKLKLKK